MKPGTRSSLPPRLGTVSRPLGEGLGMGVGTRFEHVIEQGKRIGWPIHRKVSAPLIGLPAGLTRGPVPGDESRWFFPPTCSLPVCGALSPSGCIQ